MISYAIPLLTLAILVPSVIFVQDIDSTDAFANIGDEYKFDPRFYEKILGIIESNGEVHGASADSVSDEQRYYNVILVVSRGYGDASDEIVAENKNMLVKRLESIGARYIYRASSLSFVTASVPTHEIPGLSSYNEIFKIGDGELSMRPLVDQARITIKATDMDLNQLKFSSQW